MKTTRSRRSLTGLLLLALAVTACSDSYERMFLDPERATSARIEYLFTQILTGAELQLGYWENYYRIYRNISRWGQLTGTANTEHMMNMDATQWGDYWRHYYTERSMWNLEMHDIYETLSDEARASHEVYLHLGRIIHAFQTSRMTDLWGDMPYSEAFTARGPADERILTLFERFCAMGSQCRGPRGAHICMRSVGECRGLTGRHGSRWGSVGLDGW
jgi:hypothetical protein